MFEVIDGYLYTKVSNFIPQSPVVSEALPNSEHTKINFYESEAVWKFEHANDVEKKSMNFF